MDEALRDEIKKSLIEALGEWKVLSRKPDLIPYSTDSFIRTVRVGEKSEYYPDFVVLPETTSEVQKVVFIAAKHRIPLIPKGGGSNLVGALAPADGGIVIDTIKMNKVLEVSKPDLYVTVQSGITLKELEEHLGEHGLALNQMQGSFKIATVGGSISTIGFSRKHGKYGILSDRIMSLEVVLADGRILRTGPKVLYTSTGYRLHQLFVGAEGTLGIITEATLRVEPLPEARAALMAYYDDFYAAVEAVGLVKTSGVTFVGAEAFELAEEWRFGTPAGRTATVIVDFEGTRGEVEAQKSFVEQIIRKSGGILADQKDAEDYVEGYQMIWCGIRSKTDLVADSFAPFIPADRLKEFFEKVWNEIMPKYGLAPSSVGERISIDCGRFEMAYVMFLVPKSPDGYENYEKARREVAVLAASLGGSIQACMGVGIKYRDLLDLEFSEVALETMRRIKRELDPNNIMNPGKKLPAREVASD
jgi:FAD/FMN-containing dehydrogenase